MKLRANTFAFILTMFIGVSNAATVSGVVTLKDLIAKSDSIIIGTCSGQVNLVADLEESKYDSSALLGGRPALC